MNLESLLNKVSIKSFIVTYQKETEMSLVNDSYKCIKNTQRLDKQSMFNISQKIEDIIERKYKRAKQIRHMSMNFKTKYYRDNFF